jgi:hypothetical protein
MYEDFQGMTPEQLSRMCNDNLEELVDLRRERNQSYQWRPVVWFCTTCGNGGCVEVPHVSYEIGVMMALPGATAVATVEDHAERFPECENVRIEFKRWE